MTDSDSKKINDFSCMLVVYKYTIKSINLTSSTVYKFVAHIYFAFSTLGKNSRKITSLQHHRYK